MKKKNNVFCLFTGGGTGEFVTTDDVIDRGNALPEKLAIFAWAMGNSPTERKITADVPHSLHPKRNPEYEPDHTRHVKN